LTPTSRPVTSPRRDEADLAPPGLVDPGGAYASRPIARTRSMASLRDETPSFL